MQSRQYDTIKIFGKSRLNEDTAKDINIFLPLEEIDISKCLNLIEKSIIYRDKLKSHSQDFASWYSSDVSENIKEILLLPIDRPTEIPELGTSKFFTYYYQNGYYHVVAGNSNCGTKEIGIYKEIYQFSELGPRNNLLCLFEEPDKLVIYEAECEYDSGESKNFIDSTSKNFKIEKYDKKYINFSPYRIKELGRNNITFESFDRERVLLYSLSQKIFIQDLDEKISK